MILLKKLTLKSFLSHEKTEINFSENEKVLIDGASGAGKSSIFDSILWNLYGQSRAENRALIRKGAKKGSVCLELTRRELNKAEEDTVIITRSITSVGKHSLEIAIQKRDNSRAALPLVGVRELQSWIDKDLIGASFLLFINSVAYVQGNTESFVSQTAPKRKELLLEIVKAEDYKNYYEKARKTLSELENKHSMASGRVLELKARLDDTCARIIDRSICLKTIQANTDFIKLLEPRIKELEDKKTKLSSAIQTVVFINENIKTATANKDFVENMLAERKIDVSGKDKLVKVLKLIPNREEETKELNKNLKKLQESLYSANEQETKRNEFLSKKPTINDHNFSQIDRLKRDIEKILSEPICPAGEKCPYSGDHTLKINDLKDQIHQCEEIITKEGIALANWSIESTKLPEPIFIKGIMEEIDKTSAGLRKFESELIQQKSLQKDLDNIIGIESKIPELEKNLAEKMAHIKKLEEQKTEAEKLTKPEEFVAVDTEITTFRNEQKELNDGIMKATTILETIDKDEREIASLKEKIDTLNKKELPEITEKMRKVELVKCAFGSKGIETLVIDYLLPKLEDRINEILFKLSDFRVRLDTQKANATSEGVTEGLFITILNETGDGMPFETYSGGEKLKISVAISESLATLQKVGFRMFDEIFLGLDENSTESFAAVLGSLQKNFNQILCISHLMQIKDLFDKKITIKKINGISEIKKD